MSTVNANAIRCTPSSSSADLSRRTFLVACLAVAGGMAAGNPKPVMKAFSINRTVPNGPREVLAMGRCLGDRIAEGDMLRSKRGEMLECLEMRTCGGRVAELATGGHGILRLRGGAVGQLVKGSVLIGNRDPFEGTVLREAQVKLFPGQCALAAGSYHLLLNTSLFSTQVVSVHEPISAASSFGVTLALPGVLSYDLRGPVAFVLMDQIIASGILRR